MGLTAENIIKCSINYQCHVKVKLDLSYRWVLRRFFELFVKKLVSSCLFLDWFHLMFFDGIVGFVANGRQCGMCCACRCGTWQYGFRHVHQASEHTALLATDQ